MIESDDRMTALRLHSVTGPLEVAVHQLVIAGWTGRDRAAVEHHIAELAAIGVPRPSTVPLYYRVASSLLAQAGSIEVLGGRSSGEVEPVLVRHHGAWWLTVGSDHTDRALETQSVAHSKQVCPKPLAATAWHWDEVAAHADELELSSQILERDAWVTYQAGTLAAIRPLASLIEGLAARQAIAEGVVMFCGTLAALPNAAGAAIRPAPRMKLALRDPRLGRVIEHEYRVTALPVVS